MANPEHNSGADLLRFEREIRAEGFLLRAVARAADMEMAEAVAVARLKHEREHPRREGVGERPRGESPPSS